MFGSAKELLDGIRLGEDSFLELDEVRFSGGDVCRPQPDSVADELAALANSWGGVLLLGVEDATRDITGIPPERMDTVEQFVLEVCEQSVEPPLAPVVERLWLPSTTGEEMAVLKVELERSLFVHRSPGGYLHRVGSSKRVMRGDRLARLFQQRGHTRLIWFDEQVVPKATVDDLVPALWRRFGTARTADDPDTLLHKLAMAREDDRGVIRPTVAGILMATEDPRAWLPNAYVQAVAYRGTEIRPAEEGPTYQRDAADISGPLDRQVVEACRFVHKNMKVAASKAQGRVDRPQFDMAAVFEAAVNAVAHRDYAIHGSKIRLRMFDDRVELRSPGALPNTMTVGSLAHRQSTRNEAVTSLLAKCPVPTDAPWLTTDRATLMDVRGEGVPIILDRSERLSGRTPEYSAIDESELLLTIFAATA